MYNIHTHRERAPRAKGSSATQCACCIFKAGNNESAHAYSTLFCKCATSFNELISVNTRIVCLLHSWEGDDVSTLLI
jgi:hypothetical protein